MATLQYVGARYVPKLFDDGQGSLEWQPNTYYEPLTIVTYNNSSYTSRGPISASIGNPAENGEYWALTGNFNAQIAEVEKSVNNLKTKMRTVTIDQYGAVGDGITDDTAAFKSALAFCSANGNVLSSAGKRYVVNGPITITNVNIDFGGGTLLINSPFAVENKDELGLFIHNVKFDFSNSATAVLNCNTKRCSYFHIGIENANKNGIILSGDGAYENYFNNLNIVFTEGAADSVGFATYVQDNYINDINIRGAHTAILINNQGQNFISNIHAWPWSVEPGSVFCSVQNKGPNYIHHCYIDSYQYAFDLTSDGSAMCASDLYLLNLSTTYNNYPAGADRKCYLLHTVNSTVSGLDILLSNIYLEVYDVRLSPGASYTLSNQASLHISANGFSKGQFTDNTSLHFTVLPIESLGVTDGYGDYRIASQYIIISIGGRCSFSNGTVTLGSFKCPYTLANGFIPVYYSDGTPYNADKMVYGEVLSSNGTYTIRITPLSDTGENKWIIINAYIPIVSKTQNFT